MARVQRHVGEDLQDNRRYRIPFLRAQAVLAQAQGVLNEAIAHLEEAGAVAAGLDLDGELWQIEAALADLYRVRGDEDAARCTCTAAADRVRRLAGMLANDSLRASFLATEAVRRVMTGCTGTGSG